MSREEKVQMILDTIDRISTNSLLFEDQAYEIIKDAMIPPEWLYFFEPKIIELSNKANDLTIIKIEVYTIMSCIGIAGGLDDYKKIKGLD
jgi:hypothetical protein